MKKYCTKCGHEFESVGREVICPACKQAAAEETKRMAVLRAKRASWTGESVPVRISGRASSVIRAYGAANSLPFAAALDALLKASDFFKSTGKAWEDITPYKSRRRDKHATEPQDAQTAQDVKQVAQDVTSKPQAAQEEVKTVKTVKTAAKATSKASASKAEGKATSKAVKTSKATSKATSKKE